MQIPGKLHGNSGLVYFAEINQGLSSYSMLQHIGRITTPTLVPRTCLRYLQTTLIMGGGRLVSEFMRGIEGLKFLRINKFRFFEFLKQLGLIAKVEFRNVFKN